MLLISPVTIHKPPSLFIYELRLEPLTSLCDVLSAMVDTSNLRVFVAMIAFGLQQWPTPTNKVFQINQSNIIIPTLFICFFS